MAMHPRAGQKALQEDLHNIPALVANYFLLQPDPANSAHKVEFGTSGHRGCADKSTFNEHHILAIAQAVAEVRAEQGTTVLFLWVRIHMRCLSQRFLPLLKC